MSITRREFIKSAAVVGAGVLAGRPLGSGRGKPRGTSQPNIILIFPDEWRWDGISALRSALTSPTQKLNVDRIVNNGVTFSNCYTCGPLCMPARASMMTGLYVHEHGQWDNTSRPTGPSSHSHVKRIHDEASYHTALIGKAHLNGPLADWGFDDIVQVTDGIGLSNSIWGNSPWGKSIGPNKYNQYLSYMNYYAPLYENKNPWNTPPLDMTGYTPPAPLPSPHNYTGTYDLTSNDHYDTFVGDRAAKWINNYNDPQNRPFYLQVNFPGPHYPENSTTDYRNQVNISKVGQSLLHPLPILANRPPLVKWSSTIMCDIQNMSPDNNNYQNRLMRQIYFANMLMVDHGIGQILDALNARKINKNTWIFFCSDHGEMLCDHYLMYKQVFYESATKVPLIVRPPIGQQPDVGWVSAGLTDHLDLTTSLLDVAGLPPMVPTHGTSLLPKVKAGHNDANAQTGKDSVISEIYVANAKDNNGNAYNQLMLRRGQYKLNVELNPPLFDPNKKVQNALIHPGMPGYYGSVKEAVELYDMDNNGNELTNLVNNQSPSSEQIDMVQRINVLLSNPVKLIPKIP